jgi:hypothetical protein
MAPFSKFSKEGDTIGRVLAGYSNIELSLFHAIHVATGDVGVFLLSQHRPPPLHIPCVSDA